MVKKTSSYHELLTKRRLTISCRKAEGFTPAASPLLAQLILYPICDTKIRGEANKGHPREI